jgi:hypothetical protein
MNQSHPFKPLITACTIAIFTILILLGCTSEELPPTQAGMPEVAPLSTLRPTAQIDTPPPPDPDPTPSATVAPETPTTLPTIATPTTAAATLTPLPTLEGEELELAVAELLANPMNCDVPCWWGAVPGITSIDEIKHAMSPYNFGIYEYEEGGEVVHLRFDIENNEEQGGFEVRIVYNFTNSILTGVTAYSPSISEFLTKYGQPDEIRLWVNNDPRLTNPTVWLQIVYLQKGMAVGFITDMFVQDDKVAGCFAEIERGRLRLLAPDLVTYYKDFTPIFEVDRRYLSLESATDLTMEDFMQLFSDPTQPLCIETPAELWE